MDMYLRHIEAQASHYTTLELMDVKTNSTIQCNRTIIS